MEKKNRPLSAFVRKTAAFAKRILLFGWKKDRTPAEIKEVLRYPECGVAAPKSKILQDLYDRLERCIEDQKLYLDPYISLSQVSRIVGSNRTYISNILALRGGYKYYMNEYRLKHIALRLQIANIKCDARILSEGEDILPPSKLSAIVLTSGFADMRTFRRALASSGGKWAQMIRGKIY